MNALAKLKELNAEINRHWKETYAKILLPEDAVGMPGYLRIRNSPAGEGSEAYERRKNKAKAKAKQDAATARARENNLDWSPTNAGGRLAGGDNFDYIGEGVTREESKSARKRRIKQTEEWARVPAVFIYSKGPRKMSALEQLKELNRRLDWRQNHECR